MMLMGTSWKIFILNSVVVCLYHSGILVNNMFKQYLVNQPRGPVTLNWKLCHAPQALTRILLLSQWLLFAVSFINLFFKRFLAHLNYLLTSLMQIQQLEKCLKDQFVVRQALEKALRHKSSAIDTSIDGYIPKVSSLSFFLLIKCLFLPLII